MCTDSESFFYPNIMGRIILSSLEGIIGQKNMQVVLKQAGMADLISAYPPDNLRREFPFSRLSQLNETLEQLYGPHGGRGLALRAGRATFKQGLRKFGPLVGVNKPEFRLSSMENKIYTGANVFAEILNRFSDQKVQVENINGAIFWHVERCPLCWGRTSDEPVCHLVVGLLQEALYWASGGKIFKVDETECIAKGDASCTFRIEKQPLH